MDFGASNDGDEPFAASAAAPRVELAEHEPQSAPPLQPPAETAKLAAATPRVPVHRPDPQPEAELSEADFTPPSPWPIYITALAVSVLWGFAPLAFAVGYRRAVAPLQNDAFALAVFAMLSLGPAIFVWGAAYMIRQAQKLAYETKRAKAMADDMLSPALSAAARSGHVVQGVRDEIVRAGAAAEEARETLLALRDALALETEKLTEAAATSVRTAQELSAVEVKKRMNTLDGGQLLPEGNDFRIVPHDPNP